MTRPKQELRDVAPRCTVMPMGSRGSGVAVSSDRTPRFATKRESATRRCLQRARRPANGATVDAEALTVELG
jgi:hypothetical protein